MKAIANVLHQWHAQDKRWLELPCEPNKRTHVYQWTLKHTLTAMCQFKNETNSIDLIDIHLELSYNVVHATFLYLIYTIGNKTTVWFWSCHIQYSQELILFSLPLCHSLNISHTHTRWQHLIALNHPPVFSSCLYQNQHFFYQFSLCVSKPDTKQQ